MLTSQTTSARDVLHFHRSSLANCFQLVRSGSITQALTELDQVQSDPEAILSDLDRAALLTTSIDCRLARGDLPGAIVLGEQVGRFLDHPGLAGAVAHYGRGELCAATGETELAAAHFARIARLVSGTDDDPELLPWRAGAALAAVRVGRRAEGAALAREQLAMATAADSPYALAVGLRTMATVDPRVDRAGSLREALETLDRAPAARLAAQIQTDLAGLLLLTGGADGADEALRLIRSAEAYAGRERLWPLQSRIRRLLERLDQSPQPMASEAITDLTVSEQRVARLAADGLTNKEIADQLTVSVKAIEWHLSRVYRKLGIRSRTGLSASLGA